MVKEFKKIKIPKCPKCKKLMEMRVTTEKEEGEEGKPRVLIFIGVCEKCNQIMVCDLVDTDTLPENAEELMEALERKAQKKTNASGSKQ